MADTGGVHKLYQTHTYGNSSGMHSGSQVQVTMCGGPHCLIFGMHLGLKVQTFFLRQSALHSMPLGWAWEGALQPKVEGPVAVPRLGGYQFPHRSLVIALASQLGSHTGGAGGILSGCSAP